MKSSAFIKLYRASAGSGKTYRLSLEFLKLLVVDPHAYDKILAVTFTNKATTEMQTRIMADLYEVAYFKGDLLDTLEKELVGVKSVPDGLPMSRDLISRSAKKALLCILHDYSRFQVSTIDSFFQIILRNFAHELGLGAYLNLIIDESEPLEEAVRLLKEEVSSNDSLRRWMNNYSQEKLNDNQNWDVTNDLYDFGRNIFKESYKKYEGVIVEELKDAKKMVQFKSDLYKIEKSKKEELQQFAGKFNDILNENSLCVDDLSYKKQGVYSYVNRIIKWDEVLPLAKCKRAYEGVVQEDLSKWCSSSSPKKGVIEKVASDHLIPFMIKLEELRRKNMVDINTCSLIRMQVNNVGMISDIARKNREINSARGQFLLSDTSSLLHEMIKDSDTPFIYEKIGTILEHIMIDEFQDTSETQWENFKPLIMECISKNKSNLIVGDAKQSIYRFRNGDWRIIESLDEDFEVSSIPASGNWRSMENVVNFNNFLFSPEPDSGKIPVLTHFESMFSNEEMCVRSRGLFDKLLSVYKDSKQTCPKEKQKGKGLASVEFVKKEKKNKNKAESDPEEEEATVEMLEHLLKKVISLQENGVNAKDITILVRVSKHINEIADYFSSYRDTHKSEIEEKGLCFDIISDEAYLLGASEALNMMIDAMRVIEDPDDLSSMMELYFMYMNNLSENNGENGKSEMVSEILSQVDCVNSDDFVALKENIISMGNLPLYELAEELIRVLLIDRMEQQSSFLSKFLDALTEFVSRKSPDLSSFLDYWEKYLKKKKIPMGDEAQGIKIMTIHKSKGLEFHTVIVPFCNGNFFKTGGRNNLVWCKMPQDVEPYNQYSYWPIDMKKKEAVDSMFADYFQEEQVQLLADGINILYVAFTRAVNNLIIMCDEVEKKKEEPPVPNNCSELLWKVLQERMEYDEDDKLVVARYELGELVKSEDVGQSEESKNPFKEKSVPVSCDFHYNKRRAKFRNSNKASEYIDGLLDSDLHDEDAVKKGLLLHYLFSNIITSDDIEQAADDMLVKGMISSAAEKKDLISYARKKIGEHPEWFKKGLKIYNECTILSYDQNKGRVKENRPDRVIREGNKMIIIDFKTGKKYESHERQIKRYADLLTKMGFETETHLWYI
jgi:ATP-dependent exoDNAse (exonuclease V) beta subunit